MNMTQQELFKAFESLAIEALNKEKGKRKKFKIAINLENLGD